MNRSVESAIRTVAALPDDGWGEAEWDSFVVARGVLQAELGRMDRIAERKRQDKARRSEGKWSLKDARVLVYERSGGRCEWVHEVTGRCSSGGVNVHHLAGRGGANPHHPDNLIHLCAVCHHWAHSYPALAREQGLMRSRLAVES